MFGIDLLIISASMLSLPADSQFTYARELRIRGNDVITLVDDQSNYFQLDVTYYFIGNLYFNNASEYQLSIEEFEFQYDAYDSSGAGVGYIMPTSYYLPSAILVNSDTNPIITYSFVDSPNDGLGINFDARSFEEDYLAPLNFTYTAPLSFVFNDQCNFNFYAFVDFELPNYINTFFSTDVDSIYGAGYWVGYDYGYQQGYIEGFDEGYALVGQQGGVAAEIFAGICNIALIPVNFFLMILNFEVFGINIGGFVTGIMTLAIIVILLGIIFGGRPSPSSNGGGKK